MNNIKLICTVLSLCLALSLTARAQPLDRIVAIVDDDIILFSELQAEVNRFTRRFEQRKAKLPPPHIFNSQVLDRLVTEKTQLFKARTSGIFVDDDTVERTLQQLATQNEMSDAEFRQTLMDQGYDFNDFREKIRREIIVSRITQRDVINRISISEREIDKFLIEQAKQNQNLVYQLGHILISVPEGANAEAIGQAKDKADTVQQRHASGEPFNQLAVKFSDDQLALEGGEMGWRKLGELPPVFSEAILKLSPGEISKNLRSPNGFHILKLVAVKGTETRIVKQSNVRHILIKPDELKSSDDAQAEALQIRQRLETGESFAELAKAYSDDTASAIKGGNIGWVDAKNLVPGFVKAMNLLRPKVISQPVRTQFGWHIIEVLERRNHDSTEEFKRSQAIEQIRARKADEQVRNWTRRLRDEAYIEIRL